MYHNMDNLIDVCVNHMANDQFTPEQVRAYLRYKNRWNQNRFHRFFF